MNFDWPDIVFAQQTVGSNEVWAALAGVLIGGAITFGTSYWFEKRKQTESLRARAFGLHMMIHRITDDLARWCRHYKDHMHAEYSELDPWARMRPVANLRTDNIAVPDDYMQILFSTKNTDLLNDLIELVSIRDSLVSVIELYSQKRAELGARTSGASKFKPGMIQEMILRSDEHPSEFLLLMEVRLLSRDLIEFLKEAHAASLKFLNKYRTFMDAQTDPYLKTLKLDFSELENIFPKTVDLSGET